MSRAFRVEMLSAQLQELPVTIVKDMPVAAIVEQLETPSQWLHGFSDTVMSMAIQAGICEEAWDSEDDECGPMSAPAITRTSGHGADGEPSVCLPQCVLDNCL